MKPCPERLRDKVTLVTGGARGIGRAICERFAAEGARVAVADLDATECAQVAGEIGEGTFGVRLDVTNQGSIDAAVGAVVEKFGRIDVLINNAVVWELQPLLEMTRERAARVFAVNVEGLIFTTQAVARQMITQGQGGRVINFSSQAGRRGEALSLAYGSGPGPARDQRQRHRSGHRGHAHVGRGRRHVRQVRRDAARRTQAPGGGCGTGRTFRRRAGDRGHGSLPR
jgi:nucleoside-diphosphate-sugar epimerase